MHTQLHQDHNTVGWLMNFIKLKTWTSFGTDPFRFPAGTLLLDYKWKTQVKTRECSMEVACTIAASAKRCYRKWCHLSGKFWIVVECRVQYLSNRWNMKKMKMESQMKASSEILIFKSEYILFVTLQNLYTLIEFELGALTIQSVTCPWFFLRTVFKWLLKKAYITVIVIAWQITNKVWLTSQSF